VATGIVSRGHDGAVLGGIQHRASAPTPFFQRRRKAEESGPQRVDIEYDPQADKATMTGECAGTCAGNEAYAYAHDREAKEKLRGNNDGW